MVKTADIVERDGDVVVVPPLVVAGLCIGLWDELVNIWGTVCKAVMVRPRCSDCYRFAGSDVIRHAGDCRESLVMSNDSCPIEGILNYGGDVTGGESVSRINIDGSIIARRAFFNSDDIPQFDGIIVCFVWYDVFDEFFVARTSHDEKFRVGETFHN